VARGTPEAGARRCGAARLRMAAPPDASAPPTATADLVLTVTEMLRKKGVVGKSSSSSVPGSPPCPSPTRHIGNMAPEYGATVGIFPVDQ